jgi:hypothetical protein
MRKVWIVAFTLAVGFTACGGDDEPEKPKTVSFQLSGTGKNLRFSVPKSIEAGLVRIQFTNSAKGAHGAQLGRIDGEHTLDDALKAGEAWGGRGRPLPTWLHIVGGAGQAEQGQTSTATQALPPGNYFVVDTDSNAGASFEVTGEAGDQKLPSATGTVKASEYAFASEGLKAGKNTLLFDNIGKEPHLLAALPIKPGKTIADVRRFVETEKGEPPIEEEGGFSTPILDGGLRQVIDADLKIGSYAMLCFIPDRAGGPSHIEKGMVSEAVVR